MRACEVKRGRMNFLISTPVFNGMPALRRCVGSVRGQAATEPLKSLNVKTPDGSLNGTSTSTCNDLNGFNDREAICVQHIVQDGGSTDGTVDWLRQYDQEVRGPRDGFAERGLRQEAEGHVTASPNVGSARRRGAGDVPMEVAPSTNSTRPEGPFQRAAKPRFNDSSSPCPMRHAPCPSRYSFTWSSERDAGMYDAINRAWEKGLGPPGHGDPSVVNGNTLTDKESRIEKNRDETIVSWLNSDEQYLPGTLQKVARYFEGHPEIDAVFGNMIIVDEEGNPVAARREIPLRKIYVANGFLYATSCTTFYRRKVWDKGLLKLDTRYRYSADADLALRLLDNGVRYGHLNDYLSLFGVADGENLSFLPAMNEESARIKMEHGALRSAGLRRLILAGRYVERIVHGCYCADHFHYRYAINELPEYRVRKAHRLGSRFTFDRFSARSGKGA
jgi:glycosyltransferase involved in cell wall biosynthesis